MSGTHSTQRNTSVTSMHNRAEDQPFDTFGEFALALRGGDSTEKDARIVAMQHNTKAYDPTLGYGIPEPLLDNFLSADILESPLYGQADKRTVTQGNEYRGVLVDNSVRTDGERNGGLGSAPIAEGGTYQYSTAKLRGVNMPLIKHGFIVPATNEVAEDAQSFGEDITAIAALEMQHLFENQMINGTGVGGALGIRNSPARIDIAIEGSQTISNTATYIATNAAKMMSQIWRLDRSAFYVNQELLTSILTATTGSTSHAALGPATEFAPFGTLFTRPMFPLEVAPPVGTVGDFMLCDMSDYLFAQKGGLRTAVSVHVRFLNDESLFRFGVRFNGQPKTSGQITPFSGALPRSPYVALAARS